MSLDDERQSQPAPAALAFYRQAMATLLEAKIPFLVGGGYAVHAHTGIARKTKDFDIFLLPEDIDRALARLSAAGFRTEVPFSHWLAKAHSGEHFIDLIFNSGNGCCAVDQAWFDHASDCVLLDLPVKLSPPEESIWQKAFIMERERYDGADVVHLIKSCAPALDWQRLLKRFGSSWQVLLSHLILFSFIYPDERAAVPDWVMRELLDRLQKQLVQPTQAGHVCRGTLLSREQFQTDVNESDYHDARLPPLGQVTPEQIAKWTPGAGSEKS